ncbi:MAG: hypothetical protein WCL04_08625, partial [Verrucomicrobiota bacterium]
RRCQLHPPRPARRAQAQALRPPALIFLQSKIENPKSYRGRKADITQMKKTLHLLLLATALAFATALPLAFVAHAQTVTPAPIAQAIDAGVAAAVATPTTVSAPAPLAAGTVKVTGSSVSVTPNPDGSYTVALPATWETVWLRILSIAGTVVLVARVVVKLTPTPRDDTVLESVIEFLKHLGLSTPTKL